MDVIAPQLLMALASSTAGAAGQQLWMSLRNLVRRRQDSQEPEGESELTALDEASGSEERARELAEVLARRAQQDPAFAEALAAWRREAEALEGVRIVGDTHNSVSGGTQNTVIQVGHAHGSINVGK